MPTFALDCQFAGSGFAGTAIQPGQRTVNGVMRAALSGLHDQDVLTRTCGRLDAGVSAASLVMSTELPRVWDTHALGMAINKHLPDDLVVQRVATVPDGWDALAAATSKTYVYRALHRRARPVVDAQVHWIRGRLHGERLQPLAQALVGTHDLSAFSCLRGDDSDDADPTRQYVSAGWVSEPHHYGTLWTFTIQGEGFLYKQVRGLAGAMLAVAQGRAAEAEFLAQIDTGRLRAGDGRRRVGNIAPAVGLRLEKAEFVPEPDWLVI